MVQDDFEEQIDIIWKYGAEYRIFHSFGQSFKLILKLSRTQSANSVPFGRWLNFSWRGTTQTTNRKIRGKKISRWEQIRLSKKTRDMLPPINIKVFWLYNTTFSLSALTDSPLLSNNRKWFLKLPASSNWSKEIMTTSRKSCKPLVNNLSNLFKKFDSLLKSLIDYMQVLIPRSKRRAVSWSQSSSTLTMVISTKCKDLLMVLPSALNSSFWTLNRRRPPLTDAKSR